MVQFVIQCGQMKVAFGIIGMLLFFGSGSFQSCATEADGSLSNLVRMDQQFTQSAPYSDATNITKHFGYTVPLPAYTITNELFQLRVPEVTTTNQSLGLLVWISPADDPSIPTDWERVLSKHQLLFISPRKCGNLRHPLDRFRLALDATCNMTRRYRVDRKRIYVGGFSGGARIASMLGVAYGDIFTGTLCFSGVNFYTDVAATNGQYYPATFTPNPGVLLQAKRSGRFVLQSGEHDENRENTQRIATNGFKKEGFRNVLSLEIPGLSHEMPSAATLAAALDYLADNSYKISESRVLTAASGDHLRSAGIFQTGSK